MQPPLLLYTSLSGLRRAGSSSSHHHNGRIIIQYWLIVMILLGCTCESRSQQWQQFALEHVGSLRAFYAFTSDSGSYDLYVQNDTLLHYSSATQSWDTLQDKSSTFCMDENHYWTAGARVVDIRRHPRTGDVLALLTGIDCSGHGCYCDLHTISGETGNSRAALSVGSCWISPQFSYGATAWSPVDAQQCFVAYEMSANIYKSSDGGRHFYQWAKAPYAIISHNTFCSSHNSFSDILEPSPFDTNTVFVSGFVESPILQQRLYRTTDNGITWTTLLEYPIPTSISANSSVQRRLFFHPTDRNTLFLQLDDIVYCSINEGLSWQPIIEETNLQSFGMARDHPHILYVTGDSGKIYRSNNGGTHWQKYKAEFTQQPIVGLYVFPSGDTIIAATESGLFLVYDLPVSITDMYEVQEDIRTYPNPFAHSVTITTGISSNITLTITDIAGRPVWQYSSIHLNEPILWEGIDMEGRNVANGVYRCYLYTAQEVLQTLVVLQR